MNEEEKMVWMFEQVHGAVSSPCCLAVDHNEEGEKAVHVMKHGNSCWSVTKSELVFDYVTKYLDT